MVNVVSRHGLRKYQIITEEAPQCQSVYISLFGRVQLTNVHRKKKRIELFDVYWPGLRTADVVAVDRCTRRHALQLV